MSIYRDTHLRRFWKLGATPKNTLPMDDFCPENELWTVDLLSVLPTLRMLFVVQKMLVAQNSVPKGPQNWSSFSGSTESHKNLKAYIYANMYVYIIYLYIYIHIHLFMAHHWNFASLFFTSSGDGLAMAETSEKHPYAMQNANPKKKSQNNLLPKKGQMTCGFLFCFC